MPNKQILTNWNTSLSTMLATQSSRGTNAHRQFLLSRQEALLNIAGLTKVQISGTPDIDPIVTPTPSEPSSFPPAIFGEPQLNEFALGSIAAVFGSHYQVYEGRRAPRIPNGDLLLMSRVITIQGKHLDFEHPAEITCQYDVPPAPWFLSPESTLDIPYGILMEISLQPCGFLSAYLGTPLVDPQENWFFRNLDGVGQQLMVLDLRGKTITSHARLIKTTTSSGVILQSFEFSLSVGNQSFFKGQSIFGYFSPVTMAKQIGLDSGRPSSPIVEMEKANVDPQIIVEILPQFISSNQSQDHHLDELAQVILIPGGGKYKTGYIYARRDIHPEDWYFSNHFYQDPVMPGSLGVQSVLEALKLYFKRHPQYGSSRIHQMYFPTGQPLSWKYRGQILPTNKSMELEIHLRKIESHADRLTVYIEAYLWSDRLRIYDISGAAVDLFTERV